MTARAIAITCAVMCVVAASGCAGDDASEETTTRANTTTLQGAPAMRCPFIADFPFYDLPDRMSRRQVEACQVYFARFAPGKRFEPGAPGFSSQFCADLYRRTQDDRHGECQTVRVAACQAAVNDRRFASMRRCFASTPATRVLIKESPRVIAVVSEPAVFDGIWLDPVDNTMDRWFPDPGFRVEFSTPKAQAWDSLLAQTVPYPSDLTAHLAKSPYVTVLDLRTVNLGGVDANQVDLLVNRGDPNARHADMCGEEFIRDVPCLPVTADPNDEGYVSWHLTPGNFYRLIDVSAPSGRIIVSIEGEELSELAATERILETLRVL